MCDSEFSGSSDLDTGDFGDVSDSVDTSDIGDVSDSVYTGDSFDLADVDTSVDLDSADSFDLDTEVADVDLSESEAFTDTEDFSFDDVPDVSEDISDDISSDAESFTDTEDFLLDDVSDVDADISNADTSDMGDIAPEELELSESSLDEIETADLSEPTDDIPDEFVTDDADIQEPTEDPALNERLEEEPPLDVDSSDLPADIQEPMEDPALNEMLEEEPPLDVDSLDMPADIQEPTEDPALNEMLEEEPPLDVDSSDLPADIQEPTDVLPDMGEQVSDIGDETNPDAGGYAKVLRRDTRELLDAGSRNIEDILDVRRDDMLDKGMSESEISAALERERTQLQQEFLHDAFPRQYPDLTGASDMEQLTETETAQLMRDVADQNVTPSVLPKSGGHWLDDSAAGDTTWLLDDNAEISWQKGGERHTLSGSELKEKYGIDGVEYRGKEPDFAPFEDSVIGHVELEDFSDQRTGANGTFTKARQAAADALGWEPSQVDEYMEENGLTWHECGDRKTVRAIPTEINAAFKHTGGIGIERSLGAMSGELRERYGDLALQRNSYSGTVLNEELSEARSAAQERYKTKKRGR